MQRKGEMKWKLNWNEIQKKERKVKGEIVDEWVRLTIKTNYNDEKEPCDPEEYGGANGEEKGHMNSEFWENY